MRYKLCKFYENRAGDTPLRGVYIPDFGQIWVKISILGVLHPCRCTDGGEIWHGGGDPQNRPLSKLNTGRFALRAMLPVNSGGRPIEHVVVMRCMVSQCWFVLLRQTWCMLVSSKRFASYGFHLCLVFLQSSTKFPSSLSWNISRSLHETQNCVVLCKGILNQCAMLSA